MLLTGRIGAVNAFFLSGVTDLNSDLTAALGDSLLSRICIIMDSKGDSFSRPGSEGTSVVFGSTAVPITGVSRWKIAIILLPPSANFSKYLGRQINWPSAGHLGREPPHSPSPSPPLPWRSFYRQKWCLSAAVLRRISFPTANLRTVRLCMSPSGVKKTRKSQRAGEHPSLALIEIASSIKNQIKYKSQVVGGLTTHETHTRSDLIQ